MKYHHSIFTLSLRIYRDRLRTLLSVDDLVDGILNKITDLNNTYVIFSSDHGYHMGQFGLPYDKRHMYETDTRYMQRIQYFQVIVVNLQPKHSIF